ncbi:gamma-aminobutyric acid receptor subunit alpha-6-like isoform X2 [Tachypleus tridentatus]|uniref:gamma-aminobutyric acid receptor subunit alpha-6-like isoform X2 n=1 Tax=Tachypleus tridentatus TaxID=6853 RepID=UPI003FD675AA
MNCWQCKYIVWLVRFNVGLPTLYHVSCLNLFPIFVILLSVVVCKSRAGSITTRTDILVNTSLLLDTLLSEEKYDRKLRPEFGGPATTILTDIEVRSFGSISETDMTWWDKRLVFQSNELEVLSMDWKFLQRVWIPDTYFLNGKSSYLHNVTVPNKFIRVRRDGQLKYSMRLTIKASCPMHLRKYPLDTQACLLEIGSYGYATNDVIYKWKETDPVTISQGVILSQYEFAKISTGNLTIKHGLLRETSTLLARFILIRRRGYFILQIYTPCAMIVGASWVAFWINRHDAAGRVAVGAMTVLTLVTMGFGGRTSLPKVAYPTALDWFLIMCFAFVFAAMVEYACVQLMERFDAERLRECLQHREETNPDNSEEDSKSDEVNQESSTGEPEDPEDVQLNMESDRSFTNTFRSRFRKKTNKIYEYVNCDVLTSRADQVDAYSRVVFPLTFTILNLLYWALYLYIISDEIPEDLTQQEL